MRLCDRIRRAFADRPRDGVNPRPPGVTRPPAPPAPPEPSRACGASPMREDLLEMARHVLEIGEFICDQEPVRLWCGLSYLNYIVIPRTQLQQMPVRWQREFVFLLEQAGTYFTDIPDVHYMVAARDTDGRFIKDPLAEYRHPIRLTPRGQAVETYDPVELAKTILEVGNDGN